jgi:hypothetical protein
VLRLLLEQFTRDIRIEMRMRARRTITMLVWSIIAGMLALVGLIFLLVAAAVGLTPELGAAGATAAVGAGTLVAAGIALAIGQPRRPRVRSGGAGPAYPAASAAAYTPPPPMPPPAADASSMRQDDRSGKTAMAITGAALLAGLVLGRRL